MSSASKLRPNVKQAVPFFMVKNIDSSVNFYVNGLGFSMTESWIDQGKLKWCWLVIDGAALMLQEFKKETGDAYVPERNAGDGVEIFFICEDALAIYEQIILNGILAAEPFVGNNMWVVGLKDPDGYKISFESFTDVPEETKYFQWKNAKQQI